MSHVTWRGVVGSIRPHICAGPPEDLIRLLPAGVGMLQLFLDLPREQMLAASKIGYEQKVKILSDQKVELIQLEGALQFMRYGIEGERDIINEWHEKYHTTITTQGMALTQAMSTMKMRKIIVVRSAYCIGDNDLTAKYLVGAGFDVLTVDNPAVMETSEARAIHPHAIYKTAKHAFLRFPDAAGICLVGAAMRVDDILQTLEQDLGVPVVSNLTARAWEVQKTLHIRQPITRHGRLLRELP
jgi:maleate cis-trans isomerase